MCHTSIRGRPPCRGAGPTPAAEDATYPTEQQLQGMSQGQVVHVMETMMARMQIMS